MSETVEQEGRFTWALKTARIATVVSLILLSLGLIGSVAVAVMAATDAFDTGDWLYAVPYVLCSIAVLLVVTWLPVWYGLIQAILSNESAVSNSLGRLERIETLLEDQGQELKNLTALESLSDQAKSLIYRDQEIEALREAIHDDMVRQDYKTAASMIESIEKKFGYVDEAARMRNELVDAQKATLEEKIDTAVGRVQKIIELHDWPRATRAAHKLLNAFPKNPKIASLPGRVETERANHKRRLLQEYGEAVRKNDVDHSIELLKELDRHLTPQEAAALEESARGVFKTKLHNLGVEFAIHVTDQRWADAIATGDQIMQDYPNSRMSTEVRQKMSQLRAREAETASSDAQ